VAEPAPPLTAWQRIRAGVGWAGRVGLTVAFSLATLALWASLFGQVNQEWDDSRALPALAVAAGLLGLLVLGTLLSWRRGGPALLARIERWRPWLLAAWGLVLAADGATLVWQDQLRLRGALGFQSAAAKIEASDELAQRLGRPVRPGWLVSGGQGPGQVKDGSCDYGWSYDFTVAGPKGSGKVHARRMDSCRAGADAHRQWSDSVLVIIDGSGERLELVKPRPAQAAPKTAPPPQR
jgi:hypothetical protein